MTLQAYFDTHWSVVLDEELEIVTLAKFRAWEERPQGEDQCLDDPATLRFLYLHDLVAGVILPCAWQVLTRRAYSRDELAQLVALSLWPKERRLTETASEKLEGLHATQAKREAWREIRLLVIRRLLDSRAPSWVVGTADKDFARPLVNHLVRETILWSYALSRVPISAEQARDWLDWMQNRGLLPLPGASPSDQAAWFERSVNRLDEHWTPLFRAMMLELTKALDNLRSRDRLRHLNHSSSARPQDCDADDDQSCDSCGPEGQAESEYTRPSIPAEPMSLDADDEPIWDSSELDWQTDFEDAPPSIPQSRQSDPYDDDIVPLLLSFFRWMEETADAGPGPFRDKLLLRFAATGSSHFYAIPNDIERQRAFFLRLLAHKGFQPEGDEATGAAWTWWQRCGATSRLFGDEFEDAFRELRKSWDQRVSDRSDLAQRYGEFVQRCQDWSHKEPASVLANLLRSHKYLFENADLDGLKRLLEPKTRKEFEKAIVDDGRTILPPHAAMNSDSDLLTNMDSDTRERWDPLVGLLESIGSLEYLWRLDTPDVPSPRDKRIQKYFTALWSKNRDRAPTRDAASLSNQAWMGATRRLHDDLPQDGEFSERWRSTWQRIQPQWWSDDPPSPQRGAAVAHLAVLRGKLRMVERLPTPPREDPVLSGHSAIRLQENS